MARWLGHLNVTSIFSARVPPGRTLPEKREKFQVFSRAGLRKSTFLEVFRGTQGFFAGGGATVSLGQDFLRLVRRKAHLKSKSGEPPVYPNDSPR